MANLRDIRDRIASVKSTQQITRAMKMVAAARLRKAQDRMTDARPYTYKLQEIVKRLTEKSEKENPLYRFTEEPKNILLLIMGSDRGLCGGFNSNLFRKVENEIRSNFCSQLKDETLSIICFGKKANDFFKKRNYPVIDQKIGFFNQLEYANVSEVMNKVMDDFLNLKYDEVYLAYNEFKSVIAQQRQIIKVLPVKKGASLKEKSGHNQVDTASEKEGEVKKKIVADVDYLYEPEPEKILNYVLPLFVNIQMWQASLESFASEQGARMTAMDSATENAGEIISDLELKYNQARQAAITTEISEIVSGAEALSR